MSEHCHFVFGTIHCWLGPEIVERDFRNDSFYQRFLIQSLASLLESNSEKYRLLAMGKCFILYFGFNNHLKKLFDLMQIIKSIYQKWHASFR